MGRRIMRFIVTLLLMLVGVGGIVIGEDYILTSADGTAGIPLPYVGYFLVVFCLVGFLGVNIYIGGPLDKHNDSPEEKMLPSISAEQRIESKKSGKQ
ncbi:hypothetical protein JXA32_13540 [Candidatus Sumerlaeota bacterium]|nr:hypothetical protein [Candidatus Sumerlaeota bacterium]